MADRQKAKSERLRQIVETAAELFIEQGIHQTGIRDIANRAGISLGNMYNYFASKDDLILEIAEMESAGLAQFVEALERAKDVPSGIEEFAIEYLDYVSDPITAVLSIEITSEAIRNPAVAESFDENRDFLVKALSNTIAQGMKQGSLTTTLNEVEAANLILDIIEGVGSRSGLAERRPTKATRLGLLRMIRRFLILVEE
ncbi:MAG: TetR/AcrR family transcriptional regulator [Proteobacteria bacterium]|nr:TetR/AcrR family transcriptional regulator [Pseudomonadota bacterium]